MTDEIVANYHVDPKPVSQSLIPTGSSRALAEYKTPAIRIPSAYDNMGGSGGGGALKVVAIEGAVIVFSGAIIIGGVIAVPMAAGAIGVMTIFAGTLVGIKMASRAISSAWEMPWTNQATGLQTGLETRAGGSRTSTRTATSSTVINDHRSWTNRYGNENKGGRTGTTGVRIGGHETSISGANEVVINHHHKRNPLQWAAAMILIVGTGSLFLSAVTQPSVAVKPGFSPVDPNPSPQSQDADPKSIPVVQLPTAFPNQPASLPTESRPATPLPIRTPLPNSGESGPISEADLKVPLGPGERCFIVKPPFTYSDGVDALKRAYPEAAGRGFWINYADVRDTILEACVKALATSATGK